ncbi:MAG: DUF192 domain-containing protein [Thermodesulfobacteriota bacterium]
MILVPPMRPGILAAMVLSLLLAASPMWAAESRDTRKPLPTVTMTVGNAVIEASVANTNESRVAGLLGWSGITEWQGMLLDFGAEGIYAIHMQGMKFPIDAVWINSSDEITLIYEEIRPDSGLVYPSIVPAAYCLELKAGFCKKYGVKVGQKVRFGASSSRNDH